VLPAITHKFSVASVSLNYRDDRLANIQHVAVAKFEQTHQGFQIKNHDFDLAAFTQWEKNKTLK
jgi:hypothetical protein